MLRIRWSGEGGGGGSAAANDVDGCCSEAHEESEDGWNATSYKNRNVEWWIKEGGRTGARKRGEGARTREREFEFGMEQGEWDKNGSVQEGGRTLERGRRRRREVG